MEELLRKLSISQSGKYVGDTYSIPIETFDELSLLYNQLEQSDILTKDSDESYFNMDEAHVVYYTDDYQLNLNGDLNSDVYTLIIEDKE